MCHFLQKRTLYVPMLLLFTITAVVPLACTQAPPADGNANGQVNDNDDDDDNGNANDNGADGNDNGATNGNDNGNDNGNSNGNSNGGTTTSLTFGAIGDYGDDDDNTRAVTTMMKGWDPDFIITVGDNDYSDGAFRGTFEGLELAVGQYFAEFIGTYQGEFGPGADVNRFFPTPGDHDWGDTCDDPEGLDDYLRYFTLPESTPGNERYYDFRQGNVHFISIHSLDGCEPDGVTQDSVQAEWVRETALASNATFLVGYFHNPPYSSGDRHVGEGAHMRWPFAEWGFDLILSGDDHVYERVERDGVTYLIIGLGGVDIHGFGDTPVEGSQVRFADDYGALRVDVSDVAMDVAFMAVDGTVVDSFTIEAEGGGSGGGGAGGLDPNVAPITEGEWYRPTVDTTWQWQLQPNAQDEINTTYDVDAYDIDLFDVSTETIAALQADGRRVICYFSAGTYEDFRDDADQFDAAVLGTTLEDFADERWLDIRAGNVHEIMRTRLDLAAEKGCDGVEPDNVTGFNNDTGFDLTATDQLAFNRFLANEAHLRGLAVALKNDLEQIAELVDYFDFSVNEQCHEFDECDTLQPFIDAGKPVLNAEYLVEFVSDAARRDEMCESARAQDLRTLILPVDLDDSFRFSCDP